MASPKSPPRSARGHAAGVQSVVLCRGPRRINTGRPALYEQLRRPTDPAVQAFIAASGGFGAMDADLRAPLLLLFKERPIPYRPRWRPSSGKPISPESGICRSPNRWRRSSLPVFVSHPDLYAGLNAPEIAPSRLVYDAATQSITHADGPIDYLVVGSGPGGATVANQLHAAGKRVVLIEKGRSWSGVR
ncbi:MAG: NAD(P)-binding protein [Thermomicrobiales bacterium]